METKWVAKAIVSGRFRTMQDWICYGCDKRCKTLIPLNEEPTICENGSGQNGQKE
jgi:hypothetical protein